MHLFIVTLSYFCWGIVYQDIIGYYKVCLLRLHNTTDTRICIQVKVKNQSKLVELHESV